MIKIFSRLLSEEIYERMSDTQHSELRASSELADLSVDNLPKAKNYSVKVGYAFTDRRRANGIINGKTYGGTETFSQIYEYLTELNAGVPFVDTYFETNFRSFYEDKVRKEINILFKGINDEYNEIIENLTYTKSGRFDERTRAFKKLRNFEAWKDASITGRFDHLSLDIKRHIQQCLALGRIPLYFNTKSSTITRRNRLGLTPIRAFFATGQLIDNLVVSFGVDYGR